MNWHLDYTPPPLPVKISYGKPALIMGSCFADEIGGLMVKHKLDAFLNPNGIIFNPLSIAHTLHRYVSGKLYDTHDLFLHESLWHSWDHHSAFSHFDKNIVLAHINTALVQAHSYIHKADWLVITLGSAHVYELKDTHEVVANCHKMPQNIFNKRLLTTDEIIAAFDNFIYPWRHINPNGKVLFTVSPVRYKRDGLVENNLSKAILLQCVHHLVNKYAGIYYFPAYELVIDVLRDYRFYKEDLVHPNTQAIQYVGEHFIKSCMGDDSQQLFKNIQTILQSAEHKPLHADSDSYKKFTETVVKKMVELETRYTYLSFNEEKKKLTENVL